MQTDSNFNTIKSTIEIDSQSQNQGHSKITSFLGKTWSHVQTPFKKIKDIFLRVLNNNNTNERVERHNPPLNKNKCTTIIKEFFLKNIVNKIFNKKAPTTVDVEIFDQSSGIRPSSDNESLLDSPPPYSELFPGSLRSSDDDQRSHTKSPNPVQTSVHIKQVPGTLPPYSEFTTDPPSYDDLFSDKKKINE